MWIHKCTNLCVSKGACALGVWDIWSTVIKCFVIVHSVLRAWQQVRLIPCESWTPPALPLYHWFCSQVFLEDSFYVQPRGGGSQIQWTQDLISAFCWCGSGGWIEQWPPACSGAVCSRVWGGWEMVCPPLHMSCCPQVVEFKATRGLERERGSRGCGTVIACCGEKRFSGCSTFWPSPTDISCQWWSGQEDSRNLYKYNSCIKIL